MADSKVVVAGAAEELLPDGLVSEWYVSPSTINWWIVLGGLLASAGGLAYAIVDRRGHLPDAISVNLVAAAGLVIVLGAAHEGIHGVAMWAAGARPQFGGPRSGRLPFGFYASAPGHRFTRGWYLVVGLAPLAILGAAGVPFSWLQLGDWVWWAFGVHLGCCIGDLTIVRKVLAGGRDVLCEDLRDGLRLWRIDAAQ